MAASAQRNQVTQIRALREQGIDLTDEQKAKLRTYYAKYDKKQACVYLRGKREAEWKALASASGNSLSQWIQDRVADSLAGPSLREEELVGENQELREELRALRGVNGKLGVENERLGNRIQSLEVDLMEAMDRVLASMEGV